MAKTLYNSDLINKYAEKQEITKTEAEKRIKDVFNLIGEELAKMNDGDAVKLSGFFNFHIRQRAAKQAKNPITGEDMIIPTTKTIVVKPTSSMRKKIRGEE